MSKSTRDIQLSSKRAWRWMRSKLTLAKLSSKHGAYPNLINQCWACGGSAPRCRWRVQCSNIRQLARRLRAWSWCVWSTSSSWNAADGPLASAQGYPRLGRPTI